MVALESLTLVLAFFRRNASHPPRRPAGTIAATTIMMVPAPVRVMAKTATSMLRRSARTMPWKVPMLQQRTGRMQHAPKWPKAGYKDRARDRELCAEKERGRKQAVRRGVPGRRPRLLRSRAALGHLHHPARDGCHRQPCLRRPADEPCVPYLFSMLRLSETATTWT